MKHLVSHLPSDTVTEKGFFLLKRRSKTPEHIADHSWKVVAASHFRGYAYVYTWVCNCAHKHRCLCVYVCVYMCVHKSVCMWQAGMCVHVLSQSQEDPCPSHCGRLSEQKWLVTASYRALFTSQMCSLLLCVLGKIIYFPKLHFCYPKNKD